jgi:hypothetical protein
MSASFLPDFGIFVWLGAIVGQDRCASDRERDGGLADSSRTGNVDCGVG